MFSKFVSRPLFYCLLASVIGLAMLVTLLRVLVADAQVNVFAEEARATNVSAFFSPLGLIVQDKLRSPEISASSVLTSHVGYGMNVRDPAHLDSKFAPLGFEWVKLYEQYDALPTERLSFKVLYRIQLNGPPDDLDAWAEHVEDIARAGLGLVEAYEIGNEPNQSWQWGNQVPDPAEYVAALKAAYARIKAVDPDALVVSGGLGPVGRIRTTAAGEGWPGNDGRSMDEWEYTHAMFARCATGCFDVFGYHPFGFAYPPETEPASVANHFAFRGAEDLRQIMLVHGFADKSMWATEFGWIRDPDADGFGVCKLVREFNDHFGWMLVTELQQADYLSRAFAYAGAHWPWMETMFVWNLDWNDQGWMCDHIRFFSLFHVNGDRTPAYETLMTMARGPLLLRCHLQAEPARALYLADISGPERITDTVNVVDPGGCDPILWNVSLAPTNSLQLSMPFVQGQLGQPFTFTIDTTAYLTQGADTTLIIPSGTYTASLTFTTTPEGVTGSPETVSVVLVVVPEVQRLYLPIGLKGD